jgi:hypothetical protein
MSTVAVLSVSLQQFLDSDGTPLAGGLLYSYEAGTAFSIPLALYQDAALTMPFSNPIPLTSSGRTPGPVFPKTAPAYEIVLTDANGVTVWTS